LPSWSENWGCTVEGEDVSDQIESLTRQLKEAQENLALIEERMSEYVLSTDIPLQLVKEERRLESGIRRLQRRIADLRPIDVLRQATKLMVGPVAQTLTGEPWKPLRQRLLTQASKLPHATYLDTALMEEAVDDLIQLTREIRVLLEAHRIEPNQGQLEALEHRAGRMADYLIRIYRLEAGDAPELEVLMAGQT
jgi:valyl-tRNA synthetase